MSKELYEVRVVQDRKFQRVQTVLSILDTMTEETADQFEAMIHWTPYRRGKVCGVQLSNDSGRVVNLICNHVTYEVFGFFGSPNDTDPDSLIVTKDWMHRVNYRDNYTWAAQEIMDWLIHAKMPAHS